MSADKQTMDMLKQFETPQVPGLTRREWQLLGITKCMTVVPVFNNGKLTHYTLRS